MNNEKLKKSIISITLLLLLLCCKSYGQVDLAQAGTIITNGTNSCGGAIGRNFYAYTALNSTNYMTIDLGGSYTIQTVSFGTWFSADSRNIPLAFNIDYSNDNSSWANFVTVTNNSNLNPSYTLNINARYWRLTMTAPQSGYTSCLISGFQLLSNFGGAIGNNLWSTPYVGKNIFTMSPVSIGTTYMPAGYQLAIDGSAIATSVTVKVYANWPDYVFQKKHRLPTLLDVQSYIDQNHHLPEIPSAEQIEKDGLNLGEMNKLLVKKVEELTLYLIGQQKQIDQLKKQLNTILKN
jgi:hypothetical protein